MRPGLFVWEPWAMSTDSALGTCAYLGQRRLECLARTCINVVRPCHSMASRVSHREHPVALCYRRLVHAVDRVVDRESGAFCALGAFWARAWCHLCR